MQLVIVESPTKARTIGKFLGREYTVESSYGHVRDLPKSKIGIDVKKLPRNIVEGSLALISDLNHGIYRAIKIASCGFGSASCGGRTAAGLA